MEHWVLLGFETGLTSTVQVRDQTTCRAYGGWGYLRLFRNVILRFVESFTTTLIYTNTFEEYVVNVLTEAIEVD